MRHARPVALIPDFDGAPGQSRLVFTARFVNIYANIVAYDLADWFYVDETIVLTYNKGS